MRVFLTGGSGLLGKALIEEVPDDIQIISLVRRIDSRLHAPGLIQVLVDFSNEIELEELFVQYNPNAVIHAAAEGRVDVVQEDFLLGYKVNVEFTKKIAEACLKNSAHMIFVSSNAVFGNQQIPFHESDKPEPINVYGQLKLEAESIVQEIAPSSLVLRPILMYGWPHQTSRTNPAKYWIEALRANKSISVVDDIYSQPLSVYDCARLIWKVCENKLTGILHVSGIEHITLFEFATTVAEVFELDERMINRAKSSDFPSLAPRPIDTMYSHARLIGEVGFRPKSLREGLSEMKLREKN